MQLYYSAIIICSPSVVEQMQQNKLRIKSYKKLTRFSIDHELSVQISFIDGLWKGYYEDLAIFVAAPDVGQCKNDFQEEFCMLWDEYANETDDGLILDAQRLKYKLLDLAKGVAIEDQD